MNKKRLLVLFLCTSSVRFCYGMHDTIGFQPPQVPQVPYQQSFQPPHIIYTQGFPQSGSNGSSGFGAAFGALFANWPTLGLFAIATGAVLSHPRFQTFVTNYFMTKGMEATAGAWKTWFLSFTPWDKKTQQKAKQQEKMKREQAKAVLEEKYNGKCIEFATLTDKYEELKKDHSKINQENSNYTVRVTSLTKELEFIKKNLDNLTAEKNTLVKKIEDLQSANYTMTPLIDSSATELSNLTQKIRSQEDQLKKYKSKIGSLKDQLKKKEAEFTQKKSILEQTFEDKFKEQEREWNNKHNNLNNNLNELYRKNIELNLQLQSYASNSLQSMVFPRQSQSTVLTIFQPEGER